jgi:citrate lyase beta subunit
VRAAGGMVERLHLARAEALLAEARRAADAGAA